MHDEPQELYLYGCGGHAKSVIGVLEAQGRYVVAGNAHIGDYSLIGMGAVLMPGVRVGRHVTVASNSVVSKDLPDHTVAAGMPARQVRTTR